MIKKLCEFGVYEYAGCSIPNWKELNLDPDKIYRVLKDGKFISDLYDSFEDKRIPLYLKNPFNSNPVGFVEKHSFFDGVFFISSNDDMENCELSCCYEVKAKISTGLYMGVSYDIVFQNPKLHSVSIVDKAIKPIVSED